MLCFPALYLRLPFFELKPDFKQSPVGIDAEAKKAAIFADLEQEILFFAVGPRAILAAFIGLHTESLSSIDRIHRGVAAYLATSSHWALKP